MWTKPFGFNSVQSRTLACCYRSTTCDFRFNEKFSTWGDFLCSHVMFFISFRASDKKNHWNRLKIECSTYIHSQYFVCQIHVFLHRNPFQRNWLGFYNTVSLKCNWCLLRVSNKFTKHRCWEWKKEQATSQIHYYWAKVSIEWFLYFQCISMVLGIRNIKNRVVTRLHEMLISRIWAIFYELCKQTSMLVVNGFLFLHPTIGILPYLVSQKFFSQINIQCLQLSACRINACDWKILKTCSRFYVVIHGKPITICLWNGDKTDSGYEKYGTSSQVSHKMVHFMPSVVWQAHAFHSFEC